MADVSLVWRSLEHPLIELAFQIADLDAIAGLGPLLRIVRLGDAEEAAEAFAAMVAIGAGGFFA
eukprot:CAMPEP_0170205474 /NCGR_PEP_ID=MMETSP0116_2-20130129/2281_1 /TAXON_ID=400756 /ORGANISM="Durinskia baltica, Strain CSIRO CS-38" /LENGTH=63 /DNA_ID=CAMNT_0010455865 /DNA_START=106 /DNA_END=294 /DNA_ORIENTATION=+